MNYYISDTHFGHEAIIRMDNRPFSSVEEMNQTIITNWNNQIAAQDNVYILGDFAWKSKDAIEIFPKLNGIKHLIKGNHDRDSFNLSQLFGKKIYDYLEIKDGDWNLVLCHYPIPFFNRAYHKGVNAAMLYGHVHVGFDVPLINILRREMKEKNMNINFCNVGCMMPYMNYTPQPLEVVLKEGREYYPEMRDRKI